MIRLENFFKILFRMVSLSEANFMKFVEDHLERLRSNNPGDRYAALLNILVATFGEFRTAIDVRNLNQALQESQTLTVDQVIAAFKAKISRAHTDITDRWDVGTPIYEKFFPHGPEEYAKATKGNVGSLMNRFISICDIHKSDLPTGYAISIYHIKNPMGNRPSVGVVIDRQYRRQPSNSCPEARSRSHSGNKECSYDSP